MRTHMEQITSRRAKFKLLFFLPHLKAPVLKLCYFLNKKYQLNLR